MVKLKWRSWILLTLKLGVFVWFLFSFFVMFTNTCWAVTLFSFYLLFSIMISWFILFRFSVNFALWKFYMLSRVFQFTEERSVCFSRQKVRAQFIWERVCVLTLEYEFRWKKRQNDGPRLLLLEDIGGGT